MDDICRILEETEEDLLTSDTLDTIELTLESIQLEIDRRVMNFLEPTINTYGYKVTKWLSPTTLIVSVNPITTD